jgi:DNA-binding protein HU-beta
MTVETNLNSNLEEELPLNPDPLHDQPLGVTLKKCNGSDLIARIADLAECSQLQSRAALNITTDSIMDLTKASGSFTMVGVGCWSVKNSTPRRVGQTGHQDIIAPSEPRYRVSFSASSILNEIMNNPHGERSLQLASYKEAKDNNRFNRVSNITESELHIFERVVNDNKSNTKDLYEMMKCRGLMTEQISRNFLKNLQVALRELLLQHHQILISGFGSFILKETAGRILKVPSTGKEMFVPAHRRVKFVPGKDFKTRLNNHPID